ncbi:MAG: tryptophan--tRNA ligase [Eubacteriales bacterium]|nr:tryptophan--tRNA ligase [Eubacteriales bacterium]
MSKKKIIYSAIQPSGIMTLGNFIGAVNNWRAIQEGDDNQCLFALADLHTITVRQDPKQFYDNAMSFFALLMAMGIDKDKSILYFQSHVHEHSELAWLLNCYTYVGEMNRMTQFKDKSSKHSDNINMGLMDYPVLMAADILLYGSDYVPVGVDQLQHLEIARDIAVRVNNIYGNIFTVPEPIINKVGAKIMSLQDPTAKMSKSDPTPGAVVSVLDDESVILKKFKKAVTDSGCEILYDPDNKPGISNLLTILAATSGKSIEQVQQDCQGMRYGDLKLAVAGSVIEMLRPFRKRYDDLMNNKDYLLQVAREGQVRASEMASKKLAEFKKAIGYVLI